MRFILKLDIPNETGNKALSEGDFGNKMQRILKDIKAESAYFTTVNGHRGGYIVCNLNDVSQIPAIAEPFFFWLNATIDFMPAMTPEDLAKAAPAIQAATKQWYHEQEVTV